MPVGDEELRAQLPPPSALNDGVDGDVITMEGRKPTPKHPSGGSLPVGGSTGEVLTKASDADGDADWEAGGGSLPSQWTVDTHGGLVIDLTGTGDDAITGITLIAPAAFDSIPFLFQLQSHDGSVKTYLMHDLDNVLQSSTADVLKLLISTGGLIAGNNLRACNGNVNDPPGFEFDGENNTVVLFGGTPAGQQTGVAVDTAAIHAALVNLGWITA